MNKKIIIAFLFLISSICVICNFSYAKGWSDENGEWVYYESDGSLATEVIKSSGEDRYYLDEYGYMTRDYLLEDYNSSIYYFDEDGKMVKDTWVAVDPSQVSNPIDDGPTIYLYYFGSTGKAYQANDSIARKTIDGKKYLFDSEGRMLSGWINENGEMFSSQDVSDDPFIDDYIYFAGDETDGVLREGWLEYTDGSLDEKYYEKETLWFYFNSNNKKVRYDSANGIVGIKNNYIKKKINGHTYAFDENGVMLTGWDVEPATQYYAKEELIEGQLEKKKWVYAVPSEEINKEDHDSEVDRWFYASNSGDIVKSIVKKINKEDYVFDPHGIMKTGLIVLDKSKKTFKHHINIESTDGKAFITDGRFMDKDDDKEYVFDRNTEMLYYFIDSEWDEKYGARDVGTNVLAFGDKDYTYKDEKKGEIEGYKNKDKKYYQHGILLEPDNLIGYGLVLEYYASPSTVVKRGVGFEYEDAVAEMEASEKKEPKVGNYDMEDYHIYRDLTKYNVGTSYFTPFLRVVGAKGRKINKSNTVRKDKNGEYWIIGSNGRFIKAVSCQVKYSSGKWMFRSEFYDDVTKSNKKGFKPFGTEDAYGNTVTFDIQTANGYDIVYTDQHALNFDWKD